MPLPKPQAALLFNNYFDNDSLSKLIQLNQTLDIELILAGAYYNFVKGDSRPLGTKLDKKVPFSENSDFKSDYKNTFELPSQGQAGPTLFGIYNPDFVEITTGNIDVAGLFKEFNFTSEKTTDGDKTTTIYISSNLYAALDAFFSVGGEKLAVPFVAKEDVSAGAQAGQQNIPGGISGLTQQIFKFEEKSPRNGIYSSVALEKLKNLLEEEKYTTDFFNILLNKDNNKTELAIVTPSKFYKSFKEFGGEEPRVPAGANENNIISFYKENFTKYNNVVYDKQTFVADKEFPEFETEVLLVSTLKKGYQDFDKPYTSVEFYANLKKNPQNNIVQSYISIPKEERIKFLKRFVKDKLNKETNAGVVKDLSLNNKEIYTSKEEINPSSVKLSEESNFEEKIPPGGVLGLPDPVASAESKIQSINDIKNQKYCRYDVLGYVITKKKNEELIKRVYVLNDEDNFSGYLKYFDSQIKEDVSYSYNVEQINLIHGIEIEVETLSFPTNNPETQKEFINIKQKNPSIEEIFDLLFPSGPPNRVNAEDNKSLPYYKNHQDFQIKFSSTIKQSKLVAYSPILSENLDSPDLDLETNMFQIKPSSPDVNIYAKKGESKNVLILISNLVGVEEKVTGLLDDGETKVKIIDLGFDLESLAFPVREYRVYRTEEEPTSYASFPSEPRKIVDPRNPDFLDDIEPNTEYYYYAEAIDIKNTKSDPSKILKLEMVQEQDHIFALLETYKLGNKKEQVTEKMFKKTLSVSPTFLQSAVKDKIVGGYIKTKKLFDESAKILDPNINPTHKLRVTSKKTRRRFDINVIYSYKEIEDFKELPPGAELVLEEPLPAPMELNINPKCPQGGKCIPTGGKCDMNLDCQVGHVCISGKCQKISETSQKDLCKNVREGLIQFIKNEGGDPTNFSNFGDVSTISCDKVEQLQKILQNA